MMRLRESIPRSSLPLCLAALAAAPQAGALEWVTVPSAVVSTRLDDNYRLQVADGREVRQTRVDVGAGLVAADEGFQFTLAPRIVSLDFDDEREVDRDDSYLDLGLTASDDSHSWTFGAGFASEGTLTTEFQDTGFTEVDIDRRSAKLSTGWTAIPNERSRYQVSFGQQRIDYEYVLFSPLVDYRYSSFSLSYVRSTTERSSVELGGFASELEAEGQIGNPQLFGNTDSSGVTAAWTNQFSPALQARFGIGWYRIRVEGARGPSDPEPSIDLSVSRAWSDWTLRSAYRISLQPSSYGDMYRHETLTLALDRRLTADVTLSFIAELADVESEGLATDRFDRHYGQGGINAVWRVAERCSLNFGLASRGQEYEGSRRARSNVVSVGVSYRGAGMRS